MIEYPVVATHDKKADYWFGVRVFENDWMAIAVLRRYIRDAYIEKEMKYDEIKDTEFVIIGEFNPQIGNIVSYDCDDRCVFIDAVDFINDLEDVE